VSTRGGRTLLGAKCPANIGVDHPSVPTTLLSGFCCVLTHRYNLVIADEVGNRMDSKLINLAFSMYSNPGVYALLLGSGISQAAGILTGYEIVADLIRHLAVAQGVESPEDPHTWYEHQFGKEPRYDDLLQELGHTPLERNGILRRYFEPTDEERERGIKVPTRAHKAIASLISGGYIPVVLTTNFDQLLESALDEINVTPDIISTNDMLKGMRPLRHSPITIVKLHGDYRDGRIKNIGDELQTYSPEMNALLDQVFDEYGLIICGWSAKWDRALRDAVDRTPSRRYSMYWAAYGEPSPEASDLIQRRDAQVIPITNANTFFNELEGAVQALAAKAAREHPLSIPIVVERVKRLLPRDQGQIELEELLRSAVNDAHTFYSSEKFVADLDTVIKRSDHTFDDVLTTCREPGDRALYMLSTVAWYGKESHGHHISNAITHWTQLYPWAQLHTNRAITPWFLLPSLFLIYALALAALHNQNWTFLPALFIKHRERADDKPVSAWDVVSDKLIYIYMHENRPSDIYCFSRFLEDALRPIFAALIPSETSYKNAFDLLEMLLSLVFLSSEPPTKERWIPPHLAVAERRSWGYLLQFWSSETSHSLVKAGLFGGELAKLEEYLTLYQKVALSFRHASKDPGPDYAHAFAESYRTTWGAVIA
jgi:hypothetical protein